MKRTFQSLIILLAGVTMIPGAIKAQQGFKIGLAAMPQSTWMLNKTEKSLPVDEFKYQKTWGMAFGPMVGYNFGDGIGLRMNFLYSVQGQRFQTKGWEGDSSYIVNNTRKLGYLKVPLMVCFNTNTDHASVVFNGQVGFQAGLLFAAKEYNDDEGYTPDQTLYDNITNWPSTYKTYNFLTYGPVVQAGIDVKLTYSLMANIHVRADYTLNDAENKNVTYRETEFGITNTKFYWPSDRAATNNLNVGLAFGVTYTFLPY